MAWKQGSNVAVGTHPQQTNVKDDAAELLGVRIGGLVGIGLAVGGGHNVGL